MAPDVTTSDFATSLIAALRDDSEDDAEGVSRQRALDGALSAFLDFGIRRASMNEIAQRSGVSPATLYRWYGSKDDLVAAVGIRETRRFLAEIEDHLDADASPEDQLAEMTVLVGRRLRNQPLLRRLIETEPESILPRLTTGGGPIIQAGATYLADHIRRLMERGLVEHFDPSPLSEMLARVTHSMLLTPPESTPSDDELRASARESIRWLLHLPTRNDP